MALTIDKILVPIDFSDVSLSALEYAASVAKKAKSEIILMHVVESYSYNVALSEDKGNDIITKGVEQKLNEIVEKKKLKDLTINTVQKEGKIYQQIDNFAEKEDIDLVVMGTHGATGISDVRKFVLGTNAYRVVLSAPCPVITIKGEVKAGKFDNILLPLDITKETRMKVGLTIEWAKLFGAKIHVVSISRFIDEFVVSLDKLKLQLHQVAKEIEEEGVECTTEMLRHSNIAGSVLDYADEVNADLIVIMTQQERKWNEFIIGSSARTIISDAARPVMSLRPKKQS